MHARLRPYRPDGHYLSMSIRSKAQSTAMMNPAIRIAIQANRMAAAFSRSITLRGDETK
jgi:hypothetical protein